MRGQSDVRLDQALLDAARKRPSDILTLVGAARAALAGALAQQEHVVHVALLRLVRAGAVVVTGADKSGLALYATQTAGAAPAEPFAPRASSDDAARDVTGGLRSADTRARVAADVTAHRAALRAEHREADFGSPRLARTLLRRVERGQGTVVLTTGFGDTLLRFLVHEGPWLLAAVALFLVVKFFLFDVFVIPSDSMVPSLIQGDRVVVRRPWGAWRPERWQMVTFHHPGQEGPKTTWVKRCVGLPNEQIALWHGDVYANGALLVKPDELAAALRSRLQSWSPDARGLPGWTHESEEAGVDHWAPPAVALRAVTVADPQPIDLYLELDADIPADGSAVLHYHRFSDLNPATAPEISWHLEAGRAGARLTETRREASPRGPTLLFEQKTPITGRVTLALAVVDGVVRAEVGEHAWRGARPMPSERAGFGFTTVGQGVRPVEFRLDQDLHYSDFGSIGVSGGGPSRSPGDHRHHVPEDAVFFLGDNTRVSHDSRFPEVGDIRLEKLIGPVVFRIWPPKRVGTVR